MDETPAAETPPSPAPPPAPAPAPAKARSTSTVARPAAASPRTRPAAGRPEARPEPRKKVSPPPAGMRAAQPNRSGPATMRAQPGHKTLQVADKKPDSAIHKKSVEKRLGVKESQQKPSVGDKDRGSAGKTEKKEASGARRPASNLGKPGDRSSTKTEPNKEKNDNNDKSTISVGKKVDKKWISEEKNGSLARKSVSGRPMVKHSSSVSLVRKKFESKTESVEGSAQEAAVPRKHVTQPLGKTTISQILFPKSETNATKKAESTEETEEGAAEVEVGDTEIVPSSSSLVEERVEGEEGVAGLSRRRTIPNLNIDDIPPHSLPPDTGEEEVADTVATAEESIEEGATTDEADGSPEEEATTEEEAAASRLQVDVRLEHELPESPAYRSPLLSDSEGEEGKEQERQSSR